MKIKDVIIAFTYVTQLYFMQVHSASYWAKSGQSMRGGEDEWLGCHIWDSIEKELFNCIYWHVKVNIVQKLQIVFKFDELYLLFGPNMLRSPT